MQKSKSMRVRARTKIESTRSSRFNVFPPQKARDPVEQGSVTRDELIGELAECRETGQAVVERSRPRSSLPKFHQQKNSLRAAKPASIGQNKPHRLAELLSRDFAKLFSDFLRRRVTNAVSSQFLPVPYPDPAEAAVSVVDEIGRTSFIGGDFSLKFLDRKTLGGDSTPCASNG
jgi:hypothetical protein